MGSKRCFILGLVFSVVSTSLQQGTEHKDYCSTYFTEQSGEHRERISCDNGFVASITSTHTVQTSSCGLYAGYDRNLWLCIYPQVEHQCKENTCDLFITLYEDWSHHCSNYLYVSYECKEGSNSGTDVQVSDGQNRQDDNIAVLIAVTVIICLLICGIIIFIGVYIYRNPKSKLTEMFRASRGLRHRPKVERNIYSAPHSGVSAINAPPPYLAPRLRDALGTVDRSITAMRLPAIPPTEVNRVIPSAQQTSSWTSRPPAPLPTEASSQSRETELSRTQSVSQDIVLPIPVTRYPESESDSDDSEDETEHIPKQRNSMVHASPVMDRIKQFENVNHASKTGEVEADSQQLQYVAVNVLNEQTARGTNSHVNKHKDRKEDVAKRIKDNGASSIEDEIPIEYAIINKQKTLSSAKNLSEKTGNSKDVKITVHNDGK